MELVFAILAEKADQGLSGALHLFGADFTTVHVGGGFPVSLYQFCVVARLRFSGDETDQAHTFRMELETPDGKREFLSKEEIPIKIVGNPVHRELPTSSTVIAQLAMVLPGPGRYAVHFFIDGSEVKTLAFHAIQGPPPHQLNAEEAS